jgi:DNA-binding winged helix-turn-helix (wHTH) protein
VRRLREKLGDHPERPRYIRTERGMGYRFVGIPEQESRRLPTVGPNSD